MQLCTQRYYVHVKVGTIHSGVLAVVLLTVVAEDSVLTGAMIVVVLLTVDAVGSVLTGAMMLVVLLLTVLAVVTVATLAVDIV